jgi:hypothetical protein
MSAVREALGEDALAAARAEGCAMTLEEVISTSVDDGG